MTIRNTMQYSSTQYSTCAIDTIRIIISSRPIIHKRGTSTVRIAVSVCQSKIWLKLIATASSIITALHYIWSRGIRKLHCSGAYNPLAQTIHVVIGNALIQSNVLCLRPHGASRIGILTDDARGRVTEALLVSYYHIRLSQVVNRLAAVGDGAGNNCRISNTIALIVAGHKSIACSRWKWSRGQWCGIRA